VTGLTGPRMFSELFQMPDHQRVSPQNGIVIGKGGEVLKAVGIAVRATLPEGAYLDLHVKVEKHCQDRDESLNRLGY
jgi:GTPase Era involved in 16S rRNA processing